MMGYLEEVERLLEMAPRARRQVMRELGAHYADIREDLLATGRTAREAEREAGERLGDPRETARRLNVVHGRQPWRSVGLVTVPALASLVFSWCLMGNAVGASGAALALAGVFGGMSARELRRGRRPLWLVTWLPAGLGYLGVLPSLLVAAAHGRPAGTAMVLVGLQPSPWWFCVALVVSGLPVPALAVALCRRLPQWRRLALALASVCVAASAASCLLLVGALPSQHGLGWRVSMLCFAALQWASLPAHYGLSVLLALRLFGTRDDVHPAYAPFFAAPLWGVGSHLQGAPALVQLTQPHLLVAAGVAVAWARLSSNLQRLGLLVGAGVALALYRAFYVSPSMLPQGATPVHVAFTILTGLVAVSKVPVVAALTRRATSLARAG